MRRLLFLGALLAFSEIFVAPSDLFAIDPFKPFNEFVDDAGNLRGPYARAQQLNSALQFFDPDSEAVHRLGVRHPLNDRNHILPVPLILPNDEVAAIQERMGNRIVILCHAFYDLVKGRETPWIREEDASRIFYEEGWNLKFLREIWKDRPISDVQFFLGSDLVRNSKGHWNLVEDNVGTHLGAIVDSALAQSKFEEHQPEWKKILARVPGFDFQDLLEHLLKEKGIERQDGKYPELEGVVALLNETTKEVADVRFDREENRIAYVLKTMGVTFIPPSQVDANRLQNWAEHPPKLILNFDDPIIPTWYFILHHFFATGKSSFLFSPGTNAISNKFLLTLWSKLITHYNTQAKPSDHFEIPETQLVSTDKYLEPENLIELQGLKDVQEGRVKPLDNGKFFTRFLWDVTEAGRVIKDTSGSQGSSVYITDRTHNSTAFSLSMAIMKEAYDERVGGRWRSRRWLTQHYILPSYIPVSKNASWAKFELNIRSIAYGRGGEASDVYVFKSLWGRAALNLGAGVVNVHQGAYQVAVYAESCLDLLEQAAASQP